MSNPDFSWIIEGKVGGHRKPWTEAELLFLKAQGVRALVRLEKDKFPLEDAGKAHDLMHQGKLSGRAVLILR